MGFNPSWNLSGFDKSNFKINAVLPPLTVGFGLDIKINPPDECDRMKYISPFIGSRHLSAGTNITYNESTQNLDVQGVNFSIGYSAGIPFGVTIPIN